VSLNPRYWYTDENGEVQPYVYCGLCLAGPFKKTDVNILFARVNRMAYCKKCTTTSHNLPLTEKIKIFSHKGNENECESREGSVC